jgi:protein TonB
MAWLLNFFEYPREVLTFKSVAMKLFKDFRKHPENYRIIYFEIGIIVALLLVLYSFNYRTYEYHYDIPKTRPVDDIVEEIIEPTQHDKPKSEPPQPRINITIVDDNNITEDVIEIDVLADIETPVIWEPNFEPEEEIVEVMPAPLYMAEEQPEFPGGTKAMYEFMYKNVKYPEMAKKLGITGIVYVGFVVEEDGSFSNVAIERSVGGGCDEEALRIINLMPRWSPGLQNGRPVRVRMALPVKFTLL